MGESIHQLRNVVLLAMKLWRHCRGKWPLFAVDPSREKVFEGLQYLQHQSER